ncbi:MAG: tRNA pseudouridine(13) synthase TruD [Candidatus Omnitrophota bacterium]
MKIKVKPEDFIVEELLADMPCGASGNFCLCRLTKRGENTIEVIKKVSRHMNIPESFFSYGGKKDKHASTSQYITINGKKAQGVRIEEKNYSLEYIGFTSQAMGPCHIAGNRFRIVVRDISAQEAQCAQEALAAVSTTGYPNYFDDQRFGSFVPGQGFLGEKILKGHFNGALKIYLAGMVSQGNRIDRLRKKYFFDQWGNWPLCRERAVTFFEKMAFGYLSKDAKSFVAILQTIPKEEMSLFFSAYQSHLWNELARRIIMHKVGGNLRFARGVIDNYLFYTTIDTELFGYFKSLFVNGAASKTKMPNEFTQKLYEEILHENDLKPAMFNIRKIRQAFFKASERPFVVIPQSMVFDFSSDDVYHGKQKMLLQFSLPRGSYATMLVKRVFSFPYSD